VDLTVAICTYKRHDLLRTTLESLAQCEPVDAAWELLVIDNECQEAVKNLVASHAFSRHATPDARHPVRYIPEPATGTSHARNRAVKEAAAPIVLFTDDDVTFDRAWLARMWANIKAQPSCAFWGGRVEPVWTAPRPAWFDPAYCPMLGDTIVQYVRGEQPRAWDPAQDPPFYTANLALRTDAIAAAGGFDTTVGHRGDVRMGMEDSLMVKSIAGAGGRGWYAADAVVNHPVPPDRMNCKYARQFAWRQGWLSAEMTRRGGDLAGPRGKMPRWYFRAAMGQWLSGIARMIGGLLSFNAARRFGGRVTGVFGFSKLWHAMKG
jgi:glycosyltransferase involved in cell wall biosynthesis